MAIANLLVNLSAQTFWKLVSIWCRYRQKSIVSCFLGYTQEQKPRGGQRATISHSFSKWQNDKCRGVGNFATKLVPMAMFLKISEKEGRIDHLQFYTYHMVQRIWKSFQRILRYFGSEWTSPVRNKIGCHGNVPWGIGKTGPDQENSRKYLSFGERSWKSVQ